MGDRARPPDDIDPDVLTRAMSYALAELEALGAKLKASSSSPE